MQHNNPNLFPDGAVHPSGSEPAKAAEGEDDDAEPPIDMSFPTGGIGATVIYLLSFPLMAPLFITLPDTKNNEFTFFPSFKVPGTIYLTNLINLLMKTMGYAYDTISILSGILRFVKTATRKP